MAQPQKKPHVIGEFLTTIFYAGLITVGIHSLLFEPVWIPSGSMVPSLLVGDYVFVNKFAYGYSRFSFPFAPHWFSGRVLGGAPKRGDVVVFRPPGLPDEDFVKRVVGLPGDTIQVMGGQLLINGVQVARADTGPFSDDSSGTAVMAERYLETLPGGKVHPILKQTDGPEFSGSIDANNTQVYTVPPGDLFMMGDNRDDSEDSRFLDGPVGYVPLENVLGPAVMVLGSMDLQGPGWAFWLWPGEMRWGRMFHRVS
jgi:signal peptidase I